MQSKAMIHVDSAALVKRCCEILRHEISLKNDDVGELASYIVGVKTRHSLVEMLQNMIQDDVMPSDLSHALMKCQLFLLEQKMPVMLKISPDKQIQTLKEMIEHFNYISSSIFQAGEQLWSDRVDALNHDLNEEKQRHILDVSVQIWKQHKKIKLLNYYKGLPVQVMANIERIEMLEQPMMTVQNSKELMRVLAMQNNDFVLTPDDKDEFFIHLQLKYEGRDSTSFIVKALSSIKKRKHFRLEPVEKMAIQLYRNKKMAGHGTVLDLSIQHMDISLAVAKGAVFEGDEIVDVSFQLQHKDVKGCAWVRGIRQHEQGVVLCLEFMPQAHLQRNLQKEVAFLQRKTIQEIKEKFAVAQA